MENRLLGILNKELKFSFNTEIFEEAVSTNDYCKNLAKSSKDDALIIALSQTGGKGRLGRSFFSPKESGIYLSFLLHPNLSADQCTKITTAAAVAAAQAIDFVSGKKSYIKWVNDIYLDGKKVAGILTEAGFSGNNAKVQYAVMGIGVNLFDPKGGFPDDIKDKAGSVFGKLLPNAELTVRFIKEFVNYFLDIYSILPDTLYMENYKSRSMLIGKKVYFIKNGEKHSGLVLGIDNDARLLLSTDKGSMTLKIESVTKADGSVATEGVDYEIKNGKIVSKNNEYLTIEVKPLKDGVMVSELYEGVDVDINVPGTDKPVSPPTADFSMAVAGLLFALVVLSGASVVAVKRAR